MSVRQRPEPRHGLALTEAWLHHIKLPVKRKHEPYAGARHRRYANLSDYRRLSGGGNLRFGLEIDRCRFARMVGTARGRRLWVPTWDIAQLWKRVARALERVTRLRAVGDHMALECVDRSEFLLVAYPADDGDVDLPAI